jgi:hypothetical protein
MKEYKRRRSIALLKRSASRRGRIKPGKKNTLYTLNGSYTLLRLKKTYKLQRADV